MTDTNQVYFEDDIFISYAHIDNQPPTDIQKGWISDFHQGLERRLGELLGEQPKIWRDLKLVGNDILSDAIIGRLPKVALLVSVLSPRYVKSHWCIKELRGFCNSAKQNGGIVVGDKTRIFKVVKTPIPREEYPQELQSSLEYEFYDLDQETGKFHEFNKILGAEAERKFWAKLYDLAYDIRQLLVILKKSKSEEMNSALIKKTIYLAETTLDLKDERENIKRELQQHGCIVFPNQPLPLNAPEFQEVVRENLERCTLSIHLIGEKYGIIPEATEKSIVVLQNELAAAHSQENQAFSRLIWMPIGLQGEEIRQQEFIQYLQDDPGAHKGAELLQTKLEDLKSFVQDKLHSPQKFSEPQVEKEEPLRIYLIYEQRDFEFIKPIKKYLFDQNFEVILPILKGDDAEVCERDEAEVRQHHQDNLCLCDAVMIYYGEANERWLQVQQGELRKAAGYGRLKQMLAFIYVGSPETPNKQDFRTNEASVLKNFEPFSPDILKPLITKIAIGQAGQS